MIARRCFLCCMAMLLAIIAPRFASADVTLDRFYKMGDDPAEGAAPNSVVNVTFDSIGSPGLQQLIDLTAVNGPTYRTITGRPDGGGGLGIEFNAAQQEYLHGPNLGFPEVSKSAVAGGGTLDYQGISNRGFQFWVKPQSVGLQSLVMDTNQHGVRINVAGKFSMRYGGVDYDSDITAAAGTWYHVLVVRPSGAANGSRMYVNGVAAAFGPAGYNDDFSDLVVGANTAGDATTFSGGTAEFFTGVIDDLKMFVVGTTTSTTPTNYGTFNLATDDDYIASKITPVAGDVNNDGVLNQADKDAFVAGWFDKKVVNGFQLGDLSTRAAGDLNLDGITNIFDLAIMQNALTAASLPAITPAELAPEPATVVSIIFGALFISNRRRADRPIRRRI